MSSDMTGQTPPLFTLLSVWQVDCMTIKAAAQCGQCSELFTVASSTSAYCRELLTRKALRHIKEKHLWE